ncbi:CPBP family intramembrane glutamic endopeptidase, partial [Leptolyngbya sp. AN10]
HSKIRCKVFARFIVLYLAFYQQFIPLKFSPRKLLRLPQQALFTDNHLTFILIYESVVLLILVWFLKKRGWSFTQLGVTPKWKSTFIGIGLFIATWIAWILVYVALVALFPVIQEIEQSRTSTPSSLALWRIALVSMLNPVYESLFVCGYVVTFFKKSNNLWIAVLISTVIRTAYHLYQPLSGILSVFLIGLIFAYVYAKTNRLWAVIVAHGIFDFTGLLAYSLQS